MAIYRISSKLFSLAGGRSEEEIQRVFSLRNNAPDTIELGNGVFLVKAKFGIIAKLLRHIKPLRENQDKLLIYDVKLGDNELGYKIGRAHV